MLPRLTGPFVGILTHIKQREGSDIKQALSVPPPKTNYPCTTRTVTTTKREHLLAVYLFVRECNILSTIHPGPAIMAPEQQQLPLCAIARALAFLSGSSIITVGSMAMVVSLEAIIISSTYTIREQKQNEHGRRLSLRGGVEPSRLINITLVLHIRAPTT